MSDGTFSLELETKGIEQFEGIVEKIEVSDEASEVVQEMMNGEWNDKLERAMIPHGLDDDDDTDMTELDSWPAVQDYVVNYENDVIALETLLDETPVPPRRLKGFATAVDGDGRPAVPVSDLITIVQYCELRNEPIESD